MPGNDQDKEKGLDDKRNELDTQMKQKPPVLREVSGESSKIPILDELATSENNNEKHIDHNEKDASQHSIDDIAERIEKKLSTELDEIVTLLRDTLKDSIKTELKDQIKKDTDNESDS